MVLDEPPGAALRDELARGLWLSSTLLLVEAHRNAVQYARTGRLTAAQMRRIIDCWTPTSIGSSSAT